MLANTEEPLKRVAAAIGEPCIPHFIRFVKRHTGLSPLSYRRHSSVPIHPTP
jgi:AraC-like DNA-binding protein